MHASTSQLYMLQCVKKHPSTCCPSSKAPKIQQLVVTYMREKPANYFNGTACASNLAPAIILLTLVPLQKLPLLFNPKFPDLAKYILVVSYLLVPFVDSIFNNTERVREHTDII